ncbi:ribonuclease E/G [Halobacillus campisalis]|uniref:Ribonuclease E/G n=1 Tax=Halobacillus campisalis TaxID=435909 RepID=A0ABW2K3Y1_9BACI|nr:ribonuclease E/G [Halobacillus campisalis]
MRTLALHTKTSELIALFIEQGDVIEYTAVRPDAFQLSGSIFKGTVKNIHKGMQAAFVDIGERQHAFLKKTEIPWCNGSIEQILTEGQSIYVQATKEPIGDKGAQVSADLTFPGLYLVYRPFGKRISISKKVAKDHAETLREVMTSMLTDAEGAIMRTSSKDTGANIMKDELSTLREVWKQIPEANKPGKVWEDLIIPDQFIRKYAHSVNEIVVDTSEMSVLLKAKYPSLEGKIRWEKSLENYTNHSVNEIQNKLSQREVTTFKGVQLIIDRTEAMMVIDVNSHQYKEKAMSRKEILTVNKLAAEEVLKQVRLRNLSGMILVDFISMNILSEEQQLLKYMKKIAQADPVKTLIHGMTKLGIVEMTRTRQWYPVCDQLLARPERRYDLHTQWYRLERFLFENRQQEAVLVAVHPELYDIKKQLHSEPISSKIPQELFVRQDHSIPGWQIELEGSLDMITAAIQRRVYHVDNLF